MVRFQAQTNAVLDQELDDLRERLGLRADQKADLLRELASLAAWVVRQSAEGRVVEARGQDGVQVLAHPALERMRRRSAPAVERVVLTDEESERLAAILERGFRPTPALRDVLRRLAEADRTPPELTW